MRRAGATTAAFVAVSLWAATAVATPFTFHVPEGWTDLSPGAPAENFAIAPPDAVAQARSGKLAALALDLAHVEEGFADNLNAQVSPGNTEMTPSFVAQLAEELPTKAPAGVVMRVVESGVAPIGGVDTARLVLATEAGGRKLRQLMYFIPRGEADADQSVFATLTYTTTETRYARSLPLFEASARATLGAVKVQSAWKRILDRAGTAGVVGALLGGLGGAAAGVVQLLKRRKRS